MIEKCKWEYPIGDLITVCGNRVSARILMIFLDNAREKFGDFCPFCHKIIEEVKDDE